MEEKKKCAIRKTERSMFFCTFLVFQLLFKFGRDSDKEKGSNFVSYVLWKIMMGPWGKNYQRVIQAKKNSKAPRVKKEQNKAYEVACFV